MRASTALPEPFRAGAFLVGDAVREGVGRGRLRGADLHAPFKRVRATSLTSVHELATAYATVMAPHHCFGGITAARLWGLPIAAEWSRVEPLVIARPNRTAPGYVRGTRHLALDRSRTKRAEVHGLRVLDPLSAALTLARELDHEALVQVLDALLTASRWYPGLQLPREPEKPHATPEQLEAFIERCSGMVGVPALRTAAADARAGVDSRFETITRLLIVEAGLPEPAVHPEVVLDGIEMHPDLAYTELKIAIEYEGDGHREQKQWGVDIDRYARLEAAGWIDVRVTKQHMARRGAHFIARIRAAIARRTAPGQR